MLNSHSGLERTWAGYSQFPYQGQARDPGRGAVRWESATPVAVSGAQTGRLLLLEEPTRGLDVESAAWTWKYLHHLAASGVAVVFASPDLDEIVTHANRVAVFYSGIPVLEQGSGGLDAETLSNAMVGRSPPTATRR